MEDLEKASPKKKKKKKKKKRCREIGRRRGQTKGESEKWTVLTAAIRVT